MQSCVPIPQDGNRTHQGYLDLNELNQKLGGMSVINRIELMAQQAPQQLAMTSSFGIHSAVFLHLINQIIPGIPVIMIDTGYLFKETYQYAAQLEQLLNLKLNIHQCQISAARFESHYGQLWQQGVAGIEQYNQIRKVQPLEQALVELSINTWFSGVRRNQSELRKNLDWVVFKNHRFKVHPLLDWTDRDLFQYLNKHKLPQHPLWEKGYLSVGDTHTTRSIHEVDDPGNLRFFGLKRECGIHE
ncbi:phosphoadenylylsulfate reductase (thioredoxin) [Marinicella litoralis]|uniref:Phosphoadenosine 5'-phosphosulfate reductase n=2 Tax=Marinicella litoralis TaxID=644220 RepID=A0A4R6XG86_9GAMM|nr:phosphoadenylylsulfate reductase (thioredoxin) [Marinicella litoralis]